MVSLSRWALAASFRFSKNDDDTPTLDELMELQSSLDEAFGALVPQTFAKFGIPDTPENRAIVYLLAVPAAGSDRVMLEHGCRMFAHVGTLPEPAAPSTPVIADDN